MAWHGVAVIIRDVLSDRVGTEAWRKHSRMSIARAAECKIYLWNCTIRGSSRQGWAISILRDDIMTVYFGKVTHGHRNTEACNPCNEQMNRLPKIYDFLLRLLASGLSLLCSWPQAATGSDVTSRFLYGAKDESERPALVWILSPHFPPQEHGERFLSSHTRKCSSRWIVGWKTQVIPPRFTGKIGGSGNVVEKYDIKFVKRKKKNDPPT